MVACGTGLDARLIAETFREARRRYGVAAYFLAASKLVGTSLPSPRASRSTACGGTSSPWWAVANCGEAIPAACSRASDPRR